MTEFKPNHQLPPALADDCLVGTADAAAFLNYSISHFRTLYRTGTVPPPVKLSGRKLGWKVSTLKACVGPQTKTA